MLFRVNPPNEFSELPIAVGCRSVKRKKERVTIQISVTSNRELGDVGDEVDSLIRKIFEKLNHVHEKR